MDSTEKRIGYDVEIGEKGENLFKHMFPYAFVTHLKTENLECIRMAVSIPSDMKEKFEHAFRRKFTDSKCEPMRATT